MGQEESLGGIGTTKQPSGGKGSYSGGNESDENDSDGIHIEEAIIDEDMNVWSLEVVKLNRKLLQTVLLDIPWGYMQLMT